MDKESGEPLQIEGNPVTVTGELRPSTRNGQTTVTFEFDASALEDGVMLVAFEEITSDGILIASHKDIEDAAQTVAIKDGTPVADEQDYELVERPEGGKTGSFAKTGDDLFWPMLLAAICGGAALIAMFIVIAGRRLTAKKERSAYHRYLQGSYSPRR